MDQLAPPGVPTLVAELVRIVAFLFYRDEHAAVLARLSTQIFVREGDMIAAFGISERHARRILLDLASDKLVCIDEVKENLQSKRDSRLDMDNQVASLLAAVSARSEAHERGEKAAKHKKKKHDIDYDMSSGDDENDDYKGGGGGGGGGKRFGGIRHTRRRRVKATCYYINPRYFVDVVKYRLHLMRKHLEGLQRVREGTENVYRCGNSHCNFECTMLGAEQIRQKRVLDKQIFLANAARGGSGGGALMSGIGSYRGSIYAGGRAGGGGGTNSNNSSSSNVTASSATTTTSTTTSAGGMKSSSSTVLINGITITLPPGFDVNDYEYTCPMCHSILVTRAVENIAAAASRLLDRLNDTLRLADLPARIKALDNAELGANRPADAIRQQLITMHADSAARAPTVGDAADGMGGGGVVGGGAADGGGSSSSSSGGGGGGGGGSGGGGTKKMGAVQAGSGRVFIRQQQELNITIDEEDDTAGGGGGDGGGGGGGAARNKRGRGAKPEPTQVAAASLPEYLTRSNLTGDASKSFGFVHLGDSGGQGGNWRGTVSSSSSSSSATTIATAAGKANSASSLAAAANAAEQAIIDDVNIEVLMADEQLDVVTNNNDDNRQQEEEMQQQQQDAPEEEEDEDDWDEIDVSAVVGSGNAPTTTVDEENTSSSSFSFHGKANVGLPPSSSTITTSTLTGSSNGGGEGSTATATTYANEEQKESSSVSSLVQAVVAEDDANIWAALWEGLASGGT